jgi:guanidinopropionase
MDGGVFDATDPVLSAAAAGVKTPGGQRRAPYAGMPTFLDLPAVEDGAGLDVAVIGVPMDLGVTNRPGARFGPRAVRGIERIGPFHPTFKTVPKANAGAADVGDVPFRSRYSLEQSIEDIERYYTALHAQAPTIKPASSSNSITVGRSARAAVCNSTRRCSKLDARSAWQPKPLARARKSGV